MWEIILFYRILVWHCYKAIVCMHGIALWQSYVNEMDLYVLSVLCVLSSFVLYLSAVRQYLRVPCIYPVGIKWYWNIHAHAPFSDYTKFSHGVLHFIIACESIWRLNFRTIFKLSTIRIRDLCESAIWYPTFYAMNTHCSSCKSSTRRNLIDKNTIQL